MWYTNFVLEILVVMRVYPFVSWKSNCNLNTLAYLMSKTPMKYQQKFVTWAYHKLFSLHTGLGQFSPEYFCLIVCFSLVFSIINQKDLICLTDWGSFHRSIFATLSVFHSFFFFINLKDLFSLTDWDSSPEYFCLITCFFF